MEKDGVEAYHLQNMTVQVTLNKDMVYKQSNSKHKDIYNLGGTIRGILPNPSKKLDSQSPSFLEHGPACRSKEWSVP
jgi:hypothetical protein